MRKTKSRWVASALVLGWVFCLPAAHAADDPEYVALGSSFAAAPGVGIPDATAPAACRQSMDDYAHILARKRGLSLADRSCSGSTTADILGSSRSGLPAQVSAVGPGTRLVTVTSGGNDVAYLGNLFAWSCEKHRDAVLETMRKFICASPVPAETVDAKFLGLKASMMQITEAVHARAPKARVIFVDYTVIVPETGACPDRLPISDAELDRARLVAKQLASITEAAAHDSGAGMVRASMVTKGHDLCSAEPWIAGWVFLTSPDAFGPMAYHPEPLRQCGRSPVYWINTWPSADPQHATAA